MAHRIRDMSIVVLHHRQHGVIDIESFMSEGHLIQNLVTQKTLGAQLWGSKEHLERLEETRLLLERTIANVRAEQEPPRTFPLAPSLAPPQAEGASVEVPEWVQEFIHAELAAVELGGDRSEVTVVKRVLVDLAECARGRK